MVEKCDKIWKKFLKNHWIMFILFIVGVAWAAIGAVLVFLWFVEDAQLTGLVPETLGLWTMGYLVTFFLNLIFWEVLFIGIPVILVILVIYFLWWKKLPDKESKEYKDGHLFGKRSSKKDGGGGISFLINIGFIIKVYLDGNWNEPFADWTFDYLVFSYLTVIIWILVIFGIPILIGGSWWIRHEIKKES